MHGSDVMNDKRRQAMARMVLWVQEARSVPIFSSIILLDYFVLHLFFIGGLDFGYMISSQSNSLWWC